jgi:hypothetical protein
MVHITESYITSADIKKFYDTVKDYMESGKLEKDPFLQKSIAHTIVMIEKETIRYQLIFDYGLEHGVPSVLDLVDREYLIDAFLTSNDSDCDPEEYLLNPNSIFDLFSAKPDDDGLWLLDHISANLDIIEEYEKQFADPVAYERQRREDAVYDE